MQGRYGILTYDNWNVMHMCLTAGLNPFAPVEGDDVEKFRATAKAIFGGATRNMLMETPLPVLMAH